MNKWIFKKEQMSFKAEPQGGNAEKAQDLSKQYGKQKKTAPRPNT